MSSPGNHLKLSFATEFGSFMITPCPNEPQIFNLHIHQDDQTAQALGKYCSINDAILAVARQETGFIPWDGLCLGKVPYKVHDIICWNFEESCGTTDNSQCSIAIS